jgi:hypothetical protein
LEVKEPIPVSLAETLELDEDGVGAAGAVPNPTELPVPIVEVVGAAKGFAAGVEELVPNVNPVDFGASAETVCGAGAGVLAKEKPAKGVFAGGGAIDPVFVSAGFAGVAVNENPPNGEALAGGAGEAVKLKVEAAGDGLLKPKDGIAGTGGIGESCDGYKGRSVYLVRGTDHLQEAQVKNCRPVSLVYPLFYVDQLMHTHRPQQHVLSPLYRC